MIELPGHSTGCEEENGLTAPPPSYWYEGRCPQRGVLLRLPRTAQVEAIAHELMAQLARDRRYSQEGKMYGVLLVETSTGDRQVLKAFSGLLQGESQVAGWVPPMEGREQVAAAETHTLAQLEAIKQELLELQQLPERQRYASLAQTFQTQLQELAQIHQQRKVERQAERHHIVETLEGEALAIALQHLNDQSRRDGMERRDLKRERDTALRSLKAILEEADTRIRTLKQERKSLSQQLQAQMHAVFRLTNFAGESLPLQRLMPDGAIPTGTGDCCAPKLLHYAAMNGLKPLAMAEFWWGPSPPNGDKVQGEFYGACAERCQPLMGFLLSGLVERGALSVGQSIAPETCPDRHWIRLSVEDKNPVSQDLHYAKPGLHGSCPLPGICIYEDKWLLAIDKPAGLLSVPGRTSDRQDSALSRLQWSEGTNFIPVHRLDQDTSGILLFAKDLTTYRDLSRQFQQRQIYKVYEALVAGSPAAQHSTIELPLWGDPGDRPYQTVDWVRGKPSTTHVRVTAQEATTTRVEFVPITGRTHQLRVHAAHPEGLGAAIVGDRLYGIGEGDRLHLHARELRFQHPHSKEWVYLKTETPF